MENTSIVKKVCTFIWETTVRGMWKLGFGAPWLAGRTQEILDEERRKRFISDKE